MSRLCMRSRCDRPAQVRLTYDTLRCRVFLDDLPQVPGLYQEICEFHAVRLKLPMGWELSDRRGTTPVLFDLEALVRTPLPPSGSIVTRPAGVGSETIDLSTATPPPPPPAQSPPSPAVPARGSDRSVGAVRVGPRRERHLSRSEVEPIEDRPAAATRRSGRPPSHTSGLRDSHARSTRGRGPLPTPSELFGAGRLPGIDTSIDTGVDTTADPEADRDEGDMVVVSVGDRSIETVIVLGPDSASERSDSTGGRDGRSL